jgi:hypothetical protein
MRKAVSERRGKKSRVGGLRPMNRGERGLQGGVLPPKAAAGVHSRDLIDVQLFYRSIAYGRIRPAARHRYSERVSMLGFSIQVTE